jgi:hypothetical protein
VSFHIVADAKPLEHTIQHAEPPAQEWLASYPFLLSARKCALRRLNSVQTEHVDPTLPTFAPRACPERAQRIEGRTSARRR